MYFNQVPLFLEFNSNNIKNIKNNLQTIKRIFCVRKKTPWKNTALKNYFYKSVVFLTSFENCF